MNARRAFTLVELLAVIGILVTLATLTAMSVQRIGKDTRLSKATNTLLNVLETARTQAIREHKPMLVAFVVKVELIQQPASATAAINPDWIKRQWTEAVIGRLEEELVRQPCPPEDLGKPDKQNYIDRFEPHPDFQPVIFSDGIKIAGPRTDYGEDGVWITQPELKNQEYGRMLGVLFGADGGVLTRLSGGGLANAGQYRSAVMDMDRDGDQRTPDDSEGPARYFYYDDYEDEPSLQYAQFLAVFDDKLAREMFDVKNWQGVAGPRYNSTYTCDQYGTGQTRMRCDQSEFINQFADRIFINRNTGRAEVKQR
jgi:prepilin-type N-terminal cleavage/methylation domain-containing protein